MKKLAVFISHPIQYQVPLYKKLTKQIDLVVYYYSKHGVEKSLDPQFGKVFKWDIPLLEGYKFNFLKNLSLFSDFSFFGFINFGIFKEIKKGKYDAILINSWSYLSDWFVVLAGIITKTQIFLRAENPLSHEIEKMKWKIPKKLKTKFLIFSALKTIHYRFKHLLKKIILGKILFPRIKKFLYIGEENKKFYQFYGVSEEKLIFVPYAVDNARFVDEAINFKFQISNFKFDLGINSNDIVILFCGKLIDKKRPMDLIKAYEVIIRNIRMSPNITNKIRIVESDKSTNLGYGIHLIFVGDGELRIEIENYAKKIHSDSFVNSDKFVNSHYGVHFTGFKNQTELSQYYSIADIFVLPSGVGETFGLVVNEAMCFGLPIIASDLVGCGADLIKQNENGYIYPTGNIEKLTECLLDLIQNPQKRESFGKKSFEIIQNYNYEKDIEGILKAMSDD